MRINRLLSLTAIAALLAAAPAFGAVAVATYDFDNNFTSNQSSAPALTPVDPLGVSSFTTDTVLGQSRTVWSFNGDNSVADQAGLTLNTTGLVNPENYSVDLIVKLTQRDGAWRRLLDVQNRQSDNGFYVDPQNSLDIFPVSGPSAAWTNNIYHHVVLTDDGSTVSVYLDGVSQFNTTTQELNLDFDTTDNPNQLLGFFLDNAVGSGGGEWSAGSIALARLWDGVLTPEDAQALANNPFVLPEPATLSLLALAAPILLRRRRHTL